MIETSKTRQIKFRVNFRKLKFGRLIFQYNLFLFGEERNGIFTTN